MSTFEEVAAQRNWFTGWSFERGELYQVVRACTPPQIDIHEVQSLAVAALMGEWDEEWSEKQITRRLWLHAKAAVKDVKEGRVWEPQEEIGRTRGRRPLEHNYSLDAIIEEYQEFGEDVDEEWLGMRPLWGDADEDAEAWWTNRIDEEIDNLGEDRGDAFRMHVEGLFNMEISELIDVDHKTVEGWNRYSPNVLAKRLGDVEEGLGLRVHENFGFPVWWGMVRLPGSGFALGHDAGFGMSEHYLGELYGQD